MSVESIQYRLRRAEGKSLSAKPVRTKEQFEILVFCLGGDPELIWEWFCANPAASDYEKVTFLSSRLHLSQTSMTTPIVPWTEQQVLKFLKWQ